MGWVLPQLNYMGLGANKSQPEQTALYISLILLNIDWCLYPGCLWGIITLRVYGDSHWLWQPLLWVFYIYICSVLFNVAIAI